MLSDNTLELVKNSSQIRALFEEGKNMAKAFGEENVFDLSLGNPSLPPPEGVKKAIYEILEKESPVMVHGYMNNAGFEDARAAIARSVNKEFDMQLNEENIIFTVGAAGALCVVLKSFLNPGDEVIAFAPYFAEYKSYVNNFYGVLKTVPAAPNFDLSLSRLADMITEKTKVIMINSPNNPSGVVYNEEAIKTLSSLLEEKQIEYGHPIFILSDEPYRKIVYDNVFVPFIPKYYKNTLVAYSFSKSLSLPGERIGYLVIPNEAHDFDGLKSALVVSNRILGYVNAPSLFQRVAARLVDASVDIASYLKNRNLIYNGLTEIGYSCIKPQGAFYLFPKSLEEDDIKFCQNAKKYGIIIVPGSTFACPGYFRLAYCTKYETLSRSLKGFQKLFEDYKGSAQ